MIVGRPLATEFECPRCGARRAVDAGAVALCPSCLFAAALDDDGDDSEGDEAPPFDVVTILARDGDAVTYLARGFGSAEHVALKIIDTPDVSVIIDRIRRWKTQLVSVRHAGLSRFLDAGRAGHSGVYVATEYVPGPSLDYLLRGGTFDATIRVEIARQVTDVVASLHAQGLAHMRIDTSRVKLRVSGGVYATLLGVGSSLIVGGRPPEPAADVDGLVELCRALGIELRPQPYATIAEVRAELQDAVA